MPKTRKQLKAYARENLLGRYGLVIGALLLYWLVAGLLDIPFTNMITQGVYFAAYSRVVIGVLGIAVVALIAFLIQCAIWRIHLMLARQQNPTFRELLYPFQNRPGRYSGFFLLEILLGAICLAPGIILFLCALVVAARTGSPIFSSDGLLITAGTGLSLFSSDGLPITTGTDLAIFAVMQVLVLLLLSLALLAVGCIVLVILLLSWSMTGFLLLDNPNFTVLQAIRRSRQLMKRNKWRYFLLLLSFLGWALLSILSLGIALLWIGPYYTQTRVSFYLDRCGNEN